VAIQAVVHKQFGAMLQSCKVIGFVGRFVPSDTFSAGSLGTYH
jgi:hypothetical protein